MQALWLENQTLIFRQDLPIPEPAVDEVLVRVLLAGICATDLEMVRGYYPFTGIPGHEFVGEVVDAPKGGPSIGQRVVGEINISCGTCQECRSGRSTHCERRTTLGIKDHQGTFAEYLTLPLANLHPVPDCVTDEAAVFAEPLAAALEIQQQVHIRPGDRVLVIGAGRLGQLIAQTLALTGCYLRVVARYTQQREPLAKRGIQTLIESELESSSWDLAVEATGSVAGFYLARQAVHPRGTIVLKSTYVGDVSTNLSSLVVDEITLLGSRCGPFPPALRVIENGQVDPTLLIAARYPISDGLLAFEHAARAGVLKVLLTPNSL